MDFNGVRTYGRVFNVTSTRRNEDENVVVTALDPATGLRVPRYYSSYVSPNGYVDVGATARTITARQDQAAPELWRVNIEYSSQRDRGRGGDARKDDQGNPQQDPTLKPPEVSWAEEAYTRPATLDLQTLGPIASSAGERFDPSAVEIDDSRYTLTVTKNFLLFDPDFGAQYANTTNKTPFFGRPAATMKARAPSATLQYENGQFYWKVTWKFNYRKDGWKLRVIDQGLYELDANGKPKHLTDVTSGLPLSSPDWLDGHGHRLARGPTVQPVYLEFTVYDEEEFNLLELP